MPRVQSPHFLPFKTSYTCVGRLLCSSVGGHLCRRVGRSLYIYMKVVYVDHDVAVRGHYLMTVVDRDIGR